MSRNSGCLGFSVGVDIVFGSPELVWVEVPTGLITQFESNGMSMAQILNPPVVVTSVKWKPDLYNIRGPFE